MAGCCPIPSHKGDRDNDSAFSWSEETGTWKCWTQSCHDEFGCDAIGFVRTFLQCSMPEACELLSKLLKGSDVDLTPYMSENERRRSFKDILLDVPPTIDPIDESVLKHIDVEHSYMVERGFTEAVLKYNHVGYYGGHNENSFMRDRIVFPVRTIDGAIAGFTGRSVVDDKDERKQRGIAKWLHSCGLHKYKHFPKSSLVYNAHDAKKSPKCESMIVVEGPIDVMRLQQFGIMNAVAILGTSMNRQQEMIIRQAGARELIPLFDDDEAGQKARRGMQTRFGKNDIISVRNIDLPEGKDPGDLEETEIKELLHEFVE